MPKLYCCRYPTEAPSCALRLAHTRRPTTRFARSGRRRRQHEQARRLRLLAPARRWERGKVRLALHAASHSPHDLIRRTHDLCFRRGHCHRRVTIAPETKIPNAATLVIEREDHTLGNILRMCAARPRLHLCLCRARWRTQLSSSICLSARAGSCWKTRRSTLQGTVCHTRLSPPSRSRCRRAPTTRGPLTRSTAL